MMYRPRLLNGKAVPLNWPLAFYRRLNFIAWPLESNANTWAHVFDRFCWVATFLMFVSHNEAELRYLFRNIHNLDEMLPGVPTYLILVEAHLRIFPLGLNKAPLRRFLQKFYAEIYIDEAIEPQLSRHIQKRLRPILLYSGMYQLTLVLFTCVATFNVIMQRREPVYKMIFPFDINPLPVFIPVVFTNIWVGIIVTTMLYGEDNIISEVILHVQGRYTLMKRGVNERTKELLSRTDSTHMARDFNAIVVDAIRENARLHTFLRDFQREYSYRMFIMLSFSAGLLCAILFILFTVSYAP